MGKILVFLAVLPTIILGNIIYKNDKIEKEPKSLLIKLAICGVISVILTLVLTSILGIIIPFFNNDNYLNLDALSLAIYVFVGIALIEEFSKWIFTYIIAWKNKEFNHVYDAIVYSVFVSLGFATVENLMYVLFNETFAEAIRVALMRMVLSVPGHAFFGVMMGYYLGLAKLTYVNGIKNKSMRYLFFSILVPTICHFLFDYLLMVNFDFSFLVFLFFVIIMFSVAILKIKRLSKVTTNIFNKPIQMNYVYNAFGNNNYNNNQMNYQSNINNNSSNYRFCPNCGTPIIGQYCSNCGMKHY